MSSTIYQSLNTSRREIRILDILPGSFHNDIELELSTVSLDENPQFEALSYAWGDPDLRKPVTVSGTDLQVTVNLEAALRRLRSETEHRRLWIDAICVNQDDTAERNSQVLLMSYIYTTATRVVIWLGEHDDSTAFAIDMIQSWARNEHMQSSADYLFQINCVEDLVQRSWWRRLWTVQEVVLASEAEVLCGSYNVPWEALVDAYLNIRVHQQTCCQDKYFALQKEGDYPSPLGPVVLLASHRHLNESDGLFEVLYTFRGREATDPRDKVYGLLSLASPQGRRNIKVDYNLDTRTVYTDMVRVDIATSGTLRSLSFVQSKPSKFDLPSFVVDWTMPKDHDLPIQLDRYEVYDACGLDSHSTRAARASFHRVSGHFLMEEAGFMVDEVDLVLRPLLLEGMKQIEDLMFIVDEWFQSIKDREPYVEDEPIILSFIRTIFLDTTRAASEVKFHRLDLERYREYFHFWIRIMKDEGTAADHISGTMLAFMTACDGQSFFLTKKGRFGIGSRFMKPGDGVYIMTGGRMPLVLRRQDNSFGDEWGTLKLWKLVCDTYVHGIMDGEQAVDFEKRAHRIVIA